MTRTTTSSSREDNDRTSTRDATTTRGSRARARAREARARMSRETTTPTWVSRAVECAARAAGLSVNVGSYEATRRPRFVKRACVRFLSSWEELNP